MTGRVEAFCCSICLVVEESVRKMAFEMSDDLSLLLKSLMDASVGQRSSAVGSAKKVLKVVICRCACYPDQAFKTFSCRATIAH